MKLGTLLDGLGLTPDLRLEATDCAWADIEISDITTDPNLCNKSVIYLAAECETVDSTRLGVRLDGRQYIDQALSNGAAAVITSEGSVVGALSGLFFYHARALSLLGPICARLFASPRPAHVALVTGTNGKTSTVNFCRMLWSACHLPSCSVGNLGGVCSDGSLVWQRDPELSVPETVFLHKMLRQLARDGFDHVALEATSHALFDFRLHASGATIGAFTNLTRDHLDFHGTMDEYFRVKMILFREVLPRGSKVILNADAPFFDQALAICLDCQHDVITIGRKGKTIRLIEADMRSQGQVLKLDVMGKLFQVDFNLFGEFQISNALCALGVVIASGAAIDKAVSSLSLLAAVEGRLNLVATAPSGGKIIIDYAHTPDGLRAALEACRSFTEGRLIVLFGCDGDRDAGKRTLMGGMAASLADIVILTDAQPFNEDPAKVRREVKVACPDAIEIAGRAKAIEAGIGLLEAKDTFLVSGFGHENFQCIGDQTLPFSETAIINDTLKKLVLDLSK